MRAYVGETPIKIGSIICYNGVKYQVIKIEAIEDKSSVIFKTKVIE